MQVDILKKKMKKKPFNLWFCWWKQVSIKKYADVSDGIKNKIKTINGSKENDYGKDYMKIKFNSDDDLH